MKLKSGFETMNIGETPYLVPFGGIAFHGIIRGNSTAGFILEQIKDDITEQELVDAVCREYDVSVDAAGEDVKEIVNKLREIGALEE